MHYWPVWNVYGPKLYKHLCQTFKLKFIVCGCNYANATWFAILMECNSTFMCVKCPGAAATASVTY